MPKFCVAHGCYNRSNKDESRQKNISFHRFPLKDPIRLKEWLIELKRENFQPNQHSVLCSEHFTDEDFDNTTSSRRRRSLKVNAVPSKFSFSKPFGKRKRISYQLIKLPETIIVHHIPRESQQGANVINHIPQESQSEAVIIQPVSHESQLETSIEHAPQESQSKEIIVHHVPQENQQETSIEHALQENEPEVLIGHHALQDSKSKAIIEHNILQENLVLSGSEANIHLEALSRDLSKLLGDGSSCDVMFSCQGKRFTAHRIILKMRSTVFSAILDSQMVEGKAILIKIEGFNASIFEGLLQYLYTGRVPELNQETAKQFYEIADRYAVIELKKASSDFLAKNVSQATACETLLFAVEHSDNDFRKNVISSIVDKKIPESDSDWPDFCQKHPILANEVMLQYIQKNRSNSVA